MDHLPALDEESLPPAGFERLMVHMGKAVQDFTEQWSSRLGARLGQAADEFAQAQVLVDAKKMFARRLLLVTHPGLPHSLREALWEDSCAFVRSLQQRLEADGAEQDRKDFGSDGKHAAFYRRHSMLDLISPGFPLADFAAGKYRDPIHSRGTADA